MTYRFISWQNLNSKRPVPPLFTITCMGFMCALIVWMTLTQYHYLTSADKSYSVNDYATATLKSFGLRPVFVDVGLKINNFQNFDMMRGDFSFDGTLWYIFDPLITPEDFIEKITLLNGSFDRKIRSSTQIVNGRVFILYDVRISFHNTLNYALFPGDDHHLSLILWHPEVRPGDLILWSSRSDFTILADVVREGWHEWGRSAQAGYISETFKSFYNDVSMAHPAIVFTMIYQRNSLKSFFTIIFPMLVLLLASLSIFSLDPITNWGTRISLAAQAIVGLVAYRFVLDSISPRVGYWLVSDYLFMVFLFSYIFIFFVNIIAARLKLWHQCAIIILTTGFIALSSIYLWGGILT